MNVRGMLVLFVRYGVTRKLVRNFHDDGLALKTKIDLGHILIGKRSKTVCVSNEKNYLINFFVFRVWQNFLSILLFLYYSLTFFC